MKELKRKNFLTLDDFVDCNFTSSELGELINDGLIKRVDEFYTYDSLQDIIGYYKEIRQNRRTFAIKCLNLGYTIDPSNLSINHELFSHNIKIKNYESAFEYIRFLLKNSDEEHKSDYVQYLYLLSMFIDLPEDLKIYALSFNKKDLLVDYDREDISNVDLENQIRINIYSQKFLKAISLLKQLNPVEKEKDNYLRSTLLKRAADRQSNLKEGIRALLESGVYIQCYKLLKYEAQLHQLSISEQYILIALEDLMSMIYTRKLPVRINHSSRVRKSTNIYDRIFTGDYRLAAESIKDAPFLQNNLISTVIDLIIEQIEDLIDISNNEMIFNEDSIKPLPSYEETFLKLLKEDISIPTINKILRITGKDQFKALLYSAKIYYQSGNLEEGDKLLDLAKSLNYSNDKLIEETQNQRTDLLEEYIEEKKHTL